MYGIEIPEDIEFRLVEEAREARITELERIEEETGERQHTLVADEDLDLDWSQVPPDQIVRTDVTPENFGRIAAQTAKQVIQQRIREAERAIMYEEYVDRQGEVVTGIVQQAGDRNNVLVDLGRVEALLPRSEQVDGERYEQGSRIKAVIAEVRSGTKGPQVILSRRDPELIRALFELEVPEIADGLVEIRGVAREPGYRSKIAVESHMQGVDPVGACVGPRGSRVRMVVSELRGEKIDIIPWNTEPARFVAKALSPARVREVYIDDETQGGDGHRPRRPARARDRQGGAERAACDEALRLEDRHPVGDGVRAGRGRGRLRRRRRRRGVLGPLRRDPLEREALPERRASGSQYCGVPAHQELATAEPAAANGDGELAADEPAEEPEAAAEPAEAVEVAPRSPRSRSPRPRSPKSPRPRRLPRRRWPWPPSPKSPKVAEVAEAPKTSLPRTRPERASGR